MGVAPSERLVVTAAVQSAAAIRHAGWWTHAPVGVQTHGGLLGRDRAHTSWAQSPTHGGHAPAKTRHGRRTGAAHPPHRSRTQTRPAVGHVEGARRGPTAGHVS